MVHHPIVPIRASLVALFVSSFRQGNTLSHPPKWCLDTRRADAKEATDLVGGTGDLTPPIRKAWILSGAPWCSLPLKESLQFHP